LAGPESLHAFLKGRPGLTMINHRAGRRGPAFRDRPPNPSVNKYVAPVDRDRTEKSMRFSAKRCTYSDMPSFSSQSAICCVAAPYGFSAIRSGPEDQGYHRRLHVTAARKGHMSVEGQKATFCAFAKMSV